MSLQEEEDGGESTALLALTGPLRSMSPPLLCKDGKVRLGFLCIYDISSQSKHYILYCIDVYPSWRSILSVSKTYTISNLSRIESGGRRDWHCALRDHNCQLELATTDEAPTKKIKRQGIQFMEIGSRLLRDASFKDFVTPSTIAIKNDYEGSEVCVEGVFQRYHQASGYVEFFFKNDGTNNSDSGNSSYYDHDEVTVGIYVTDFPLATMESIVGLQPQNCVVRASSVLPMYLWGKLYGFAATIRTHIEVVPLQSNDSRRMKHVALEPPGPLVCERCSLFSAWRSFTSNKLSYCTVEASVSQLESAWDHIYGSKVLSITSFASSNSNSSSASSCSPADPAILPHFSQYKHISDRTLRSLKQQFVDVNYLQLYKVRNGRDSDLLVSQFPCLLTVGNVVNYIHASDTYAAVLGGSTVYDNKFYPTIIMGYFCDIIEKYHISTQLPCRRVLVGSCSSERMLRYSRMGGAGGDGTVFLMFELTDALDNSIKCIVTHIKRPWDGGACSLGVSEDENQDAVVFIEDFSVYLEKGCQLPGSNGANCSLYLLVDPTDIKFVYSRDSSTHGAAVDNGLAVVPETSSVRWILASNSARQTHSSKGAGTHEVCGVVVGKEISVEQSNGKRQLTLQLKDRVHSDVITAYFVHTFDYAASEILVGSVIRLSQVLVNTTAKYTYIKTSVATVVDILGMVSFEQLRASALMPFQNCNSLIDSVAAAGREAPVSIGASSIASAVPPNNLLCNLQKSNKTLWRFVGNVSLIKYIKCVMRCSCSDRAAIVTRSVGLQCSSCHSSKNLSCHWAIQCVFDDGSAEVKMNVEGAGRHVFSILAQANGGRDVLEGVVDRVERFARDKCDGGGFYMRTFVENPFFATNDNTGNDHKNDSNARARQRAYDDMKAQVLHFLQTCTFPLLQVVGKCILSAKALPAAAAAQTQQKQISLQWDNTAGRLHSLQFKKVDSFSAPLAAIEAATVERLNADEDVYAEAMKQLALVSGKFD